MSGAGMKQAGPQNLPARKGAPAPKPAAFKRREVLSDAASGREPAIFSAAMLGSQLRARGPTQSSPAGAESKEGGHTCTGCGACNIAKKLQVKDSPGNFSSYLDATFSMHTNEFVKKSETPAQPASPTHSEPATESANENSQAESNSDTDASHTCTGCGACNNAKNLGVKNTSENEISSYMDATFDMHSNDFVRKGEDHVPEAHLSFEIPSASVEPVSGESPDMDLAASHTCTGCGACNNAKNLEVKNTSENEISSYVGAAFDMRTNDFSVQKEAPSDAAPQPAQGIPTSSTQAPQESAGISFSQEAPSQFEVSKNAGEKARDAPTAMPIPSLWEHTVIERVQCNMASPFQAWQGNIIKAADISAANQAPAQDAAKGKERPQKEGGSPKKRYIIGNYTYEDIIATAWLRKLYGHLVGLVEPGTPTISGSQKDGRKAPKGAGANEAKNKRLIEEGNSRGIGSKGGSGEKEMDGKKPQTSKEEAGSKKDNAIRQVSREEKGKSRKKPSAKERSPKSGEGEKKDSKKEKEGSRKKPDRKSPKGREGQERAKKDGPRQEGGRNVPKEGEKTGLPNKAGLKAGQKPPEKSREKNDGPRPIKKQKRKDAGFPKSQLDVRIREKKKKAGELSESIKSLKRKISRLEKKKSSRLSREEKRILAEELKKLSKEKSLAEKKLGLAKASLLRLQGQRIALVAKERIRDVGRRVKTEIMRIKSGKFPTAGKLGKLSVENLSRIFRCLRGKLIIRWLLLGKKGAGERSRAKGKIKRLLSRLLCILKRG